MAIRDVPVSELVSWAVPTYFGPGWGSVVEKMLADPVESVTVDLLVQELAAHGRFREPVVVSPDEPVVSNGMHRIVATIVSGEPTITVADSFDDLPDPGDWIRLEMLADGDGEDDNLFEELSERLRSFPLPGDWADYRTFGASNGVIEASWYCSPDLTDDLIAELRRRAAAIGVRLTVLSCEANAED